MRIKKIISIFTCLCILFSSVPSKNVPNNIVFAEKSAISADLANMLMANFNAYLRGKMGMNLNKIPSAPIPWYKNKWMPWNLIVPCLGGLWNFTKISISQGIGIASMGLGLMAFSEFMNFYNIKKAKKQYSTVEKIESMKEYIQKLTTFLDKELVGHDDSKPLIKRTFINIASKIAHNNNSNSASTGKKATIICFHGPGGVGKSHAALGLAKTLNPNVLILTPTDIPKSGLKSVFEPRISKINYSEINQDSSAMLYLKSQPKGVPPVIILDDCDKFPCPKENDELLRSIYELGMVGNETCQNAVIIITSNETLSSIKHGIYEDDGTGSRTALTHERTITDRTIYIPFGKLSIEDQDKLIAKNLKDMLLEFLNNYKIFLNIDPQLIHKMACLVEKDNEGARPIDKYLAALREYILSEVVLKAMESDISYEDQIYNVSAETEDDELKFSFKKENSQSIESLLEKLSIYYSIKHDFTIEFDPQVIKEFKQASGKSEDAISTFKERLIEMKNVLNELAAKETSKNKHFKMSLESTKTGKKLVVNEIAE